MIKSTLESCVSLRQEDEVLDSENFCYLEVPDRVVVLEVVEVEPGQGLLAVPPRLAGHQEPHQESA